MRTGRILAGTGLSLLLVMLLGALTASPAWAATSCKLAGKRGVDSDGAGPTDYRHYVLPRGPIDVTVLFADFSDAPGDATSTQALYDGVIPGADAYLRTASRNRTHLRANVHQGWIRMPQPSTAYNFAGNQSAEQHERHLAEAVAAADPAVDFSRTDVVLVFSPPGAAIPVSPTATPGERSAFATADGKRLGFGVSFGNDVYLEDGSIDVPYGSHVAAHELLHTFGLPDLYRSGAEGDAAHRLVGSWDLMGWLGPGFGLTSWHLQKLRWLSSRSVVCLKRRRGQRGPRRITATLRPVGSRGGRQAIVIPLTRRQAWVVESRQRVGLDRGICSPGVLVYKVDSGRRTGEGPFRVLRAGRRNLDCDDLAPNTTDVLEDATYGRGRGRRSAARDRRTGLTVKVLRDSGRGSRVRISISR